MDIKVEIKELSERKGQFIVEGVHPYFVNAIRRTLMAEVPKLAVEDVTFYDNTSALFDESIAHRLALIPLKTDPSTLNLVGQVNEETGEPGYMVRYRLTAEGPKMVTSGDLECDDAAYAPVQADIPIVELLDGQRLILEATAILGQGTQHAKWQVCSAVGYKYFPTAKFDNRKISPDVAADVVAKTPAGILELKDGKIVVVDEANVNMADGEYARQHLADGFEMTYDDRKFVFSFETDGSLSAEDALHKAVELLKERFGAFRDLAGDLK
jgi:DNA-directed RNA polymerase subunit D